MTKPKPTLDPVSTIRQLAMIMETHGVTELKCGDIVMVRNPLADAIKQDKRTAAEQDEYNRLKGMSPDQQDRALSLGGLGPMGSG
jgi:hypothetical protein